MPNIVLNLTDDSLRRVFTDADMARVAGLGDTIRFNPKTDDPESFRAVFHSADAVLTCWGSRPLKPEDVEGRDRAVLVAHAAGSVRGVLAKELLTPRVRLTQGAAAIAVAVAQYTVALMVMALRQTQYRTAVLRSGSRDYGAVGPYRDLNGLTVGLLGLSRVGSMVAGLLPPYGVGRVLAFDPYCPAERAASLGVTLVSDLDALLAESDVVSLHAPVTDETRNLIDARRVGLLRRDCAFINTARAQLVDQDALFARAMAGEIQVYADVSTPEPLPQDHPAWQCPHIYLTPHIAGPTQQTLRRMATYAIDEIERFLSGQPLQHEVTADRYDLLA